MLTPGGQHGHGPSHRTLRRSHAWRADLLRPAQDSGVQIEFGRKKNFPARGPDQANPRPARNCAGTRSHLLRPRALSVVQAVARQEDRNELPQGRRGECIHYYFYFIDEELGPCCLRVPTWAPFRSQFYFNGHNALAVKLARQADRDPLAWAVRRPCARGRVRPALAPPRASSTSPDRGTACTPAHRPDPPAAPPRGQTDSMARPSRSAPARRPGLETPIPTGRASCRCIEASPVGAGRTPSAVSCGARNDLLAVDAEAAEVVALPAEEQQHHLQ
jgi:hypothetical protein